MNRISDPQNDPTPDYPKGSPDDAVAYDPAVRLRGPGVGARRFFLFGASLVLIY